MLRFSAHLGYLFTDLPLTDRFAAARRAGFAAVEHPDPYVLGEPVVRRLLDETNLAFVQFALPAGDPSRGEKGFAALPGRRDEFDASVRTGLDYARALCAPYIQVQSGLASDEVGEARQWDCYLENLAAAADAAALRGVGVLIEPIGPATIAGYYMSRSDLAVQALDALGRPNVKLLFDVFHSANAGVDPVRFIRENASKIGHIHIADHPGRNEPGTGTLDFEGIFRAVEAGGFAGWIGCEYKPLGATEDGLAWHRPYGHAPNGSA